MYQCSPSSVTTSTGDVDSHSAASGVVRDSARDRAASGLVHFVDSACRVNGLRPTWIRLLDQSPIAIIKELRSLAVDASVCSADLVFLHDVLRDIDLCPYGTTFKLLKKYSYPFSNSPPRSFSATIKRMVYI